MNRNESILFDDWKMRPFCDTGSFGGNESVSLIDSVTDFFLLFRNEDPELPLQRSCSEDTIFVWIPTVILLMVGAIELIWIKSRWNHSPNRSIPWSVTIFYLCKMLSAILLYTISIGRIIYWYLHADHNPFGLEDPWAPVLGDGIRAFAWFIVISLYTVFRRHHHIASGSIFMFLAGEVLFNLYTTVLLMMNVFGSNSLDIWTATSHPAMFTTKIIYLGVLYFLFFIECLSDDDAVKCTLSTRQKTREKLISPEIAASFGSKLTFGWFTSLVFRTWRRGTIRQEDLWHVSPDNTCQTVLQPFKKIWTEIRSKKDDDQQVGIMSVLFRLYWTDLLWVAGLKLIASLFAFVNPVVMDWVIAFLNPQSTEPYWKGFVYAVLMFTSPMMESMFTNQHEYQINKITMRMKICVSAIVYNKSLRLSNTAKQRFSTGEIVNLISVDALRIVDLINNINTVWSAPLQIGIGVYLLWLQLNVASLAGFSWMLLVVPLNIVITNRIRYIQMKLMAKKDARAKLMNEVLDGIKVIKLNAWERHFERKLTQLRSMEMMQLKYNAYCQTLMNTLFSSSAILVALLSFITYTLISPDNVLDANRAFVSLAVFNIIRIPLVFLPMFFAFAGIAMVSIQRLNDYLNAPEISDYTGSSGSPDSVEFRLSSSPVPLEPMGKFDQTDDNGGVAIRIKDGNFTWFRDDPIPTIFDVNLTVKKRQLVAIVGGIGSGKSSLLSAILGEMEKLYGNVEVNGRVAYVPQEAWILNATIRENIILNKRYDEKKYKKVLEACALNFDMAMFAAGDMTEVGEKGTNLSGGQKQRISLARAVYSNSDIYLLDNPLSALDVHVGKHIYDQVIGSRGCLRNKTRLLVTTKMSLLPSVDQIVYISRGEIKETGTFQELLQRKGPFSEYVAEYFLDHSGGFETDLDVDDAEFVTGIETQIKPVIDRVQKTTGAKHHQRKKSITMQRLHSTFSHSQSLPLSSQSSIQQSIIESDEIFSENVNITQGRLIQAEEMAEGSVDLANHRIYFQAIGYCVCGTVLVTLLLSNVFQVLGSLWLSDWADDAIRPEVSASNDQRNKRIMVYGILAALEIFFMFLGTIEIWLGCVGASRILHNQMLSRILRAPMSFFDTTPIGRILNRFTRDIDVVDLRLSTNIRLFAMQTFRSVVAFCLIVYEAPLIMVFLVPLIIGYYLVQKLYINTSRQLKRIEAVTRSPMNNHLSETVNGTTSIRAYGLTRKFTREMFKKIDDNNQSYWLSFAAARWLAVRLEFMGYTIVFLATIFAVLSRGRISPGLAGLAISYSLNITSILNLLIRAYSELETNFVSVERVVEYMQVPRERQLLAADVLRVPVDWPSQGEVIFENYSTQYRPGLKLCLKRINLTIGPGNKVAIVGRTGSGKSSLTLALFRVLEPVEGTIVIDGVDIRKISLETLRRSLTIVPQEPVIFTASLRENVDTLSEYGDPEILEALEQANLKDYLESIDYDLNHQIESGDNLSTGQRQLICLARALLKRSSVIVFDEATASVDFETDAHIHDVIFSEQFRTKTVLMIAHRLDRIMSYDYILVMDNGEMIEYDQPSRLIAKPDGQFYSLAREANLI